ncbi:MAG: peptide chain release factor N(5)-glutamine methyltransferase [Proteobacteria bacterium]|nr:peptide chain release factor N(5)-glutamine methyltransferase [Pseudomonadota bacterium]
MTKLIEPSEYRLLLAAVLDQSAEWVFMHLPKLSLTDLQKQYLDSLLERRLKGEPIAKILGYKEFYGRRFATGTNTLDPRSDSETLIDAVLQYFPKNGAYKILDLGLGTGCLLFTLLCELPLATGIGVDCSHEALNVAKKNQDYLQLVERSICIQSSWSDAVKGEFDIIVCNPPYIGTSEILDTSTMYDPYGALFSGQTGLEAYQQVIPRLKDLLKPSGKVFLEIGKGQELCVEKIALKCCLQSYGAFPDLSGTIRVLCYTRNI